LRARTHTSLHTEWCLADGPEQIYDFIMLLKSEDRINKGTQEGESIL